MSNTKHEKISDHLARSAPFLAKRVDTFGEAYPTIAKLKVHIKEFSYSPKEVSTWSFNEENFRHSVDCSNSRCFGGGFLVGRELHSLVQKRKETANGTSGCCGYEGSPKGRRRVRDCMHGFTYTFEIEYKSEDR